MPETYLNSGQVHCYDAAGRRIQCPGSGQDAETAPGAAWPRPRFAVEPGGVHDALTGLTWLPSANQQGFPLTWGEALAWVAGLNQERHLGHGDWRLPNRRELRSLISHQTRDPALPQGHPFTDVFLGWYWTSTSSAVNPAYAWYVHLEGGRMFYGKKDHSYLVWPCRGAGNGALAATGQTRCYDQSGREVTCPGSGQDAELAMGLAWPRPRFQVQGEAVTDRLSGLVWARGADLGPGPCSWQEALDRVAELDRGKLAGLSGWRLPTINQLESLVDAACHHPALPQGHPFQAVQDVYWSATSSGYEPDWAMALYMDKGAVGVGRKQQARFQVWAVTSRQTD